MKVASAALVLSCLSMLGSTAPVGATSLDPADIGEAVFNRLFDSHGVIPACADEKVHKKIKRRFRRHTAPNVLQRALAIDAIALPRQSRYVVADPSPLARRYCRARAHFSDNRHRTLYYFIEESTGFVGVKWNVEFCVIGMDPWRVYDGRCRVARPREGW